MMFDGVPVRFPELTLAFLEAGSGWVPYFLQRMDEEWEKRGHAEAKLLTKSPTDYVRGGRIYFSCEADEPLLPQALQWGATSASSTLRTSHTGTTATRSP